MFDDDGFVGSDRHIMNSSYARRGSFLDDRLGGDLILNNDEFAKNYHSSRSIKKIKNNEQKRDLSLSNVVFGRDVSQYLSCNTKFDEIGKDVELHILKPTLKFYEEYGQKKSNDRKGADISKKPSMGAKIKAKLLKNHHIDC